MAVGNGVIAAGQDGACCVMKYKRSTQEEETKATVKEGEALYWIVASICIQVQAFSNVVAVAILLFCFFVVAGNREQKPDVRQRVRKGQKSGKDEGAGSDLKEVRDDVSVASVAEVSSDLNPQDPLQKVVRFSSDMSLLLTGGTDGHIRVWEVNIVLLCS